MHHGVRVRVFFGGRCRKHERTSTAKPAREGFVSVFACTEPVRTGIGAVYVEYGRRDQVAGSDSVFL